MARLLRRADTAGLPEDYDLAQSRYGFGVSWQASGQNVDIDLQCVVVDHQGVIIDCAYYNNLKAVRAITHSGDETAYNPNGIEELVWVAMRKLPPNVALLVFVVAAYSGGCLNDVRDGKLHVFEDKESNEIARFEMERSQASVDVVAAMFRGATSEPPLWKLRIIDEPAQQGQHFMDILPLLSQVVRTFIPSAPAKQKVAFAMEKGGVLDLPQEMSGITVGLGWDVDEGQVDLDVSAVLMDSQGQDLEAVFFGRVESEEHGITHTGDNLTGEGEGDDEQIRVDLLKIGAKVHQVFFVVNIYSPGKNFLQVAEPYCRVIENASGAELCRYALRDAGTENGLLISRICREAGGRWGFHALGLPCKGRTYKDSLPQIRATTQVKTASLMLRAHSSGELSHQPQPYATGPPTIEAAVAPEAASKGCCTVQ